MVTERLDNSSISTAITEAMTEDSSIGENIEDAADWDIEIEILMKEPYSLIEEFMVSTFHAKNEIKISVEHLRKV